jgi:hypothetical protein
MSKKLTLEDIGEAMREAKKPSEAIQATDDGKLFAQAKSLAPVMAKELEKVLDGGDYWMPPSELERIAEHLIKAGWRK